MRTVAISHTSGNRKAILVFAGWSSTPRLYASLSREGWDVILVFDYSDLSFDTSILSQYSTIFIISWSLGVAAAEESLRECSDKIAAAFAVNGTLHPVSDEFGIPEGIYTGTEQNLSSRNLLKFQKRISSADDIFQFPIDKEEVMGADIDALQLELRNIGKLKLSSILPWKRVYISENDKIFPATSQLAYWGKHPLSPQIIKVNAGHYIPLQKIIEEVTPNLERIGNHFEKALVSYDDNADAQHIIAENIIQLIPDSHIGSPLDILEIGPGSGLLTRQLGEQLNVKHATFIDLYQLPKFEIADEERYIVGDAENIIENLSGFDIIISASTLQWFADVERFFRNAAGALKEGGSLICSTFLPGTMKELEALRPSPLIYRSREEIESFVAKYFEEYTLWDGEITLEFFSRREALLHLKRTGVAGGTSLSDARSVFNSSESGSMISTLTYKPLYIVASKPKQILG